MNLTTSEVKSAHSKARTRNDTYFFRLRDQNPPNFFVLLFLYCGIYCIWGNVQK